MVTGMERLLVQNLVKAGKAKVSVGLFRVVEVEALNPGAQATLNRLKQRQKVDEWHHAPCCPANHWHRQRLVFGRCNCGAELHKVK